MQSRIFTCSTPSELLKDICEIKADDNEKLLAHFIPPSGLPELVFYLGPRRQIIQVPFANGFIKGQFEQSKLIEFYPNYHFVAIRLHAFGLWQFFGMNAALLNNAVIDVDDSPLCLAIADLLQGQSDFSVDVANKIVHLLATWPKTEISATTQHFLQVLEQNSNEKIQNLLSGKGIGLRNLQRLFSKEVGLSPKKYLRILRMNQMEEQLALNRDIPKLVLDFDLSDRKHLDKEFKLLRAHSPKALLEKKLLLQDQLPPPEFLNMPPQV